MLVTDDLPESLLANYTTCDARNFISADGTSSVKLAIGRSRLASGVNPPCTALVATTEDDFEPHH